ncbi:Pre-mRNA-splicing factor ATP-dependent RNA helicase [Alternaria arborescens]|nr:Pre-mRNA-splicing factor ATP-dependent RNA helicase [Alternaria arborescens]
MSSAAINHYTGEQFSENYYAQRKLADRLPVSQHKSAISDAVDNNDVVVLVGETGSGKSTQVPQMLLESNIVVKHGKKVVVTQPRQLAAQKVAERIAEELDVRLGSTVGVRYRGVNNTTANVTCLEIVTDGTLLALAKSDPALSEYGVVIIDEAHQHTMATDLLLGLLQNLAGKNSLKIIIMSATMDAQTFINFFPRSTLVEVPGREFKVHIKYTADPPQGEDQDLEILVDTILQTHLMGQRGNILVFVSGVRMINKVIQRVEDALKEGGDRARFAPRDIGTLRCYPLHSQLTPDAIDAAVESVPPTRADKVSRKLIVATNIAETSVTITGVTHVIDTMKVKSRVWNPVNESYSFKEQYISHAVAKQRAGRAGRTREGVAYRTCTEFGFRSALPQHSVPSVLESDMISECMDILSLGKSPINFPYIVAPATETVTKALGILREMDAVNARGTELTARGKALSRLPIDPYLAAALLESPTIGCSDEVLTIVSMIEVSEGGGSLFIQPIGKEEEAKLKRIRNEFCGHSGDHVLLLNVYFAWRTASAPKNAALNIDQWLEEKMLRGSVLRAADMTRRQLLNLLHTSFPEWKCRSLKLGEMSYYPWIILALARGQFMKVARRAPTQNKKGPMVYQTLRYNQRVELLKTTDLGAPSTANEWVIYHECRTGEKKDNILIVSPIVPEMLIKAVPTYFSNVEFFPDGPTKTALVKIIVEMTGEPEDSLRGYPLRSSTTTTTPSS